MYVQQPLLRVTEFARLMKDRQTPHKRIELVNGKIVEQTVDDNHRHLIEHVSEQLGTYIRPRRLGQVAMQAGYYRSRDEYNLRFPDVSFVSFERTQPISRQGFTPYMPDIAILIHPPTLSMIEVAERGLYFLKNGSSLVWILHPDSTSVDVCTRSPKKSFRVYKVPQGGSLGGSDVLPGLTLDVKELFSLSSPSLSDTP